jgi:DNA invertase Pin-like site-specific DNA recombinase
MSETRVHIYCRVSSTGQEDGYSLDTQEAACRSWVQERGLVVASVARLTSSRRELRGSRQR